MIGSITLCFCFPEIIANYIFSRTGIFLSDVIDIHFSKPFSVYVKTYLPYSLAHHIKK